MDGTASPAPAGPTPERIMQFAWGFTSTLIVDAALRLRLFDQLDNGPKSADELAKATGASHRGITSILNALVGLELLKREGDRYVAGPEAAAFLVSGKPGFYGMLFRHISEQLLPKWIELPEVVR